MRLRYLLFALFVTIQAAAYYPYYPYYGYGWWCGPGYCGAPAGYRERFPRHTACCCNGYSQYYNGCYQRCCSQNCCPQPQPVSPATGYSPCNNYVYRMCGSIELSADALYWSPTRTPIVAWILTAGNPPNVVRTDEINPSYDWGVRGFVQWNLPCSRWFIRGGYHWIRTRDRARQRGGNFVTPLPWGGNLGIGTVVNAADAFLEIRYQRAELTGGFNMWQGRCSRFYAYGGGLWFLFNHDFDSDIHGRNNNGDATADFVETIRSQGVGGVMGFGGEYNFTQGLYGVAKVGAIAAAAERTLKQVFRGPTEIVEGGRLNASWPSTWGLLPGIEAQIAARYTVGACGLYLSGEIGWEIQHYFNVLRTAQGPAATAQTTFVDCGFCGPYAGLKLRF